MIRTYLAAAAALCVAGSAMAADGKREVPIDDPGMATTMAGTGVKPGDEIICRREPPPLGSRIGARRICKTADQWERQQQDARLNTERHQRQGICGEGACGPGTVSGVSNGF